MSTCFLLDIINTFIGILLNWMHISQQPQETYTLKKIGRKDSFQSPFWLFSCHPLPVKSKVIRAKFKQREDCSDLNKARIDLWILKKSRMSFLVNPFHAIGLFLYALKLSENQRFSGVLGDIERPVAWNELNVHC